VEFKSGNPSTEVSLWNLDKQEYFKVWMSDAQLKEAGYKPEFEAVIEPVLEVSFGFSSFQGVIKPRIETFLEK